MPRKRNANRTVKRNASTANTAEHVVVNGTEPEYFLPGCYDTPQLIRQATPYTSAYLPTYPTQWTVANPATYVVDAIGRVCYFSDFEYLLQIPENNPYQMEISYQFYNKDDEVVQNNNICIEDPEDEETSACKIERLDNDTDDVEEMCENVQQVKRSSKTRRSGKSSKRVYRAKQGYLVEEPSDDSDEPNKGN